MLREYQEDDLNGVMTTWEGASAIAHPFLPEDFVAEIRENIPKLYLPNTETWVLEEEGVVIGFLSLMGNEVAALFVAPDHQGRGFGRQLMDKACELRGQLEVEVFSENAIGRRFYEKYGMKTIAEKSHEETGFALLRLRLSERGAPSSELG